LPSQHHQRLRAYFDTYGCIRCSRSNVVYGGNGICSVCIHTIQKRLVRVDKKLQSRLPEPQPNLASAYLKPYRSARQLLADLIPKTDRRTAQKRAEPKHPQKVYFKWLT
jgi:hypothetical protein